jgi:hypothetical protein
VRFTTEGTGWDVGYDKEKGQWRAERNGTVLQAATLLPILNRIHKQQQENYNMTIHYRIDPPGETNDHPSVEELVDFYRKIAKEAKVPGDPGFDPTKCPGARSAAAAHFQLGWVVSLVTTEDGCTRWDTQAHVTKGLHDRIDQAKKVIDLMTGAYPTGLVNDHG